MCRADGDAIRIPPPEHVASHCLTAQYRRCEVFRRFLTTLAERPERWRSTTPDDLAVGQRPRVQKRGS